MVFSLPAFWHCNAVYGRVKCYILKYGQSWREESEKRWKSKRQKKYEDFDMFA
jgi:hypothetical protein